MELMAVNEQWRNRPDDQRFTSMEELKKHVLDRKRESWTAAPFVKSLRVVPTGEKEIGVEVYDPTMATTRTIHPTNFAFGQLAQYAKAPASYLRQLPAELAAINLQWGLESNPMRDQALMLAQSNGHNAMRAMTSTSYGRIWDSEVVQAVEKVNADGRWQIPAAMNLSSGESTPGNTRSATTLYASDRDVFIFLVDPAHPIEIKGEQLYRGFYTWNSEVGSAVFGVCSFLYRCVCRNRIIWGATDVKELRIRHTGGAPQRFAYEGAKYLQTYADESTRAIEAGIGRAMEYQIPKAAEKDGVSKWLQERGFQKSVATAAVETARGEEGEARSLWNIVNGITAYARTIPHTNDRVDLEAKAGSLMNLVAA